MTQQEFLTKCKKLGIYNSPNVHHDFLATGSNSNDEIHETPKYFYKKIKMGGNNEIRLWKESKRVSVVAVPTKSSKK